MPDPAPATIHDLFASESPESASAIPFESNAELAELRELVAKEVSARPDGIEGTVVVSGTCDHCLLLGYGDAMRPHD